MADGACLPISGRERAVERFGFTGRKAKWIAVAGVHGGVSTRSRFSALLRFDRCRAPSRSGVQAKRVERPMRRVEQLWKTGLSDAANAREPAYPLVVQRG